MKKRNPPIPLKLKKLFESMSKGNDKIIESGQDVQPICFILNEDNSTEAIIMKFKNSQEKTIVRNKLFKHISQRKVIGYFLFQDALMTKIDNKTGEGKISDVVIRTLFTPKRKYVEIIFYKNGKITNREKLKDEEAQNFSSIWNIWETTPDYEKIEEQYNKFKENNPERYRGVR